MILISMMPRERARRLSLGGALFFFVAARRRAVHRRREEWRGALDRARRRPAAAVGIPEALLRRRHGLAAVAQGEGQERCRCSCCRRCLPASSPSC